MTIKGTTSSGFKFKVSDSVKDDWRLTKAFADMDSGDESRILAGSVNVVRLLLGKQENALYEHIQEPDGTVPHEKVFAEVAQILEAIKAKKS